MTHPTLIIGCGEVGKRLSHQLIQQKLSVSAISHQQTSKAVLDTMGISTQIANLDKPESLQHLVTSDVQIYYFAPPPISGVSDTRMKNFVASLNARHPPKRIVYISTTGIYGDHQGNWVDESTPTPAPTDRSKRRLDAEESLIGFCTENHCEFMILRVAGIYCYPKLPLQRLKNGLKILKTDIAPSSNRIHADDLANICFAAMNSNHCNEIYNVADGNPSSISDYFIQVARCFNLPKPEEIEWQQAKDELSPAMMSYLNESKKIKNTKMLNDLQIKLKYPTLSDGLEQCLNESKL